MSYHSLPGDFEVELPGPWPPCPSCGSETRVAVASRGHDRVAFCCGAMDRLDWTKDGGRRRWIAAEHFRPDGVFDGLIPDEYLRPPARRPRSMGETVDERRAHWIRHEQHACASCGATPVRDPRDRANLLYWLKAHRPALFGEVIAVVNATQPRPTLSGWFDALLGEREDLVLAIRHAVQDANLRAAPSIPPAVLAELGARWGPAMRKVATATLAFGFCAACCEAERDVIPARAELLQRHVRWNHDGSETAARADRATWAALERVLDALDLARRERRPRLSEVERAGAR